MVNKTDKVLALKNITRGRDRRRTSVKGLGVGVREAALGRVVREVFPGKVTLELRPK